MNFDNRWRRDQARRTWHGAHVERRLLARHRRRRWRFGRAELIATALVGIFGGLGWAAFPLVTGEAPARAVADTPARLLARPDAAAIRFTLCHSGGGANCVVDGDTFRMGGTKIRIADIDTPETHPARCAREAELGAAATRRLHALLNSGAVSLETAGRDADRYGRKLRRVSVDGRGVGETLVAEGLARPYAGGYREGWCG
ncbi:thermonuclease family protein [Sphingomonas koreensis]